MVFFHRSFVPRLGILLEPDVSLLSPDGEFSSGHGIAESEGDKLHDLTLLPMGEFLSVRLYLLVAVQEITHEGMLVSVDNSVHYQPMWSIHT